MTLGVCQGHSSIFSILISMSRGLSAIADLLVFLGFNFDFLRTSQEIGWEEHVQYDLFSVGWDVKLSWSITDIFTF